MGFLQVAGGLAPFRDLLGHVRRDVHRLTGVDEGALDRLLDPPGGVGGESRPPVGIEAFDGFEKAEQTDPRERLDHALRAANVRVFNEANSMPSLTK